MLYQPDLQPRIITSHIRYSPQVAQVMLPNAKKVTIVRDPYYQFISTFDYFHHIGVFSGLPHGTEGLNLFFEKPYEYFKNDTRWGSWLSRNINFFDLGKNGQLETENTIQSQVDLLVRVRAQ